MTAPTDVPRRRGRPPKSAAGLASSWLRIRLRPDQSASYRAAAAAAGLTLTDWILAALDRLATPGGD